MTISHQNQKEKWIERFEQTKFAKGGGSCFECCDYEGMYTELKALIKQVQEEAYEKGFSDAVRTEINQVIIKNSRKR